MSRRWCFPFAAVVGQADVKEALLIALVNPKTGGVLVAAPGACVVSIGFLYWFLRTGHDLLLRRLVT